MPRTVFATFDTETEAERALGAIGREVSLLDSAVLSDGVEGSLTLDSLTLTPEERSACQAQLKRGGFLMIAQASEDTGDSVLRILHSMAGGGAPLIIAEASPASSSQASEPALRSTASASPAPAPAAPPAETVVEEQRIPVVEEELRVGKREVVRSRANVHSQVTEAPVREEMELLEERIDIQHRPANRVLSEEEVSESGLLQDRVFRFTAVREEAIVSKEAFVREELIVTKDVETRVEEIHDTVRRTEVEVEGLEPGAPRRERP